MCVRNAGLSFFDMDKFELLSRYTPVSAEAAKSAWDTLFEASLTSCSHGAACTMGRGCTQGKRITPVRLPPSLARWVLRASDVWAATSFTGCLHRRSKTKQCPSYTRLC